VDQFVDRTRTRPSTFFEGGVVAHVPMADPVCPVLRAVLEGACAEVMGAEIRWHRGGAYVCIEGPQFSTRAESFLYRSWGASVVGMTNLPEARLAREAEIAYATLAMATDYDCWHDSHDAVTVDQVIAVMQANVAKAQKVLRTAVGKIAGAPESPAWSALRFAIMTSPQLIPAAARERLALLIDPHLPKEPHA
jgi:5'-methylthioadenosine phosphorylase